jgi:hypothetical protein
MGQPVRVAAGRLDSAPPEEGGWLAGTYTREGDNRKSYAAGYPEEQDLYLVNTVEVDPDTGEFAEDENGDPVWRDSGILVSWVEVEFLEFIEA